MYFKIKLNKNVIIQGKEKKILETYFTEAEHFAEAGMKVIQEVGKDVEIEDVCMMKNFKPSANDYYMGSKIFTVKVAEDVIQEDGLVKIVKYSLPVFAKSSDEVNDIMKKYISQGLENMRLTTISETKWIWIK